MTLGNKIQLLREEHSLSQKELASITGVTTGAIAEWEADESAPSLAELSRLSKALNVSSDVLLDATIEAIPSRTVISTQEPMPVVTPPKQRKRKGWLVGTAALCGILIAAVVILLSLGVFTPKPLAFSENTAAIETADASVVKIYCYDYDGNLAATGSGFLAFDDRTIITNYHVMSSAYTCKVSTNQDITYDVLFILEYSEEHDIAILLLSEHTGLQPLTLGDSTVIKKGETVVAIGSPLGIKNTVSTGVLSGRLMDTNMDVLQFTAPISSGSSGGALFDNDGNVIGITFASIIDGQNLNLAIPIELATNLYQSRGEVKKVGAIYIDEHPYVTELSKYKYKNKPSITIDELLANPAKYDGKTVKVYGYISSIFSYWYNPEWGKYSDNFTPYERQICYIAPASNISGNGEYDYLMYESASDRAGQYSVLEINLTTIDQELNFLPSNAAPGDRICCIGEIGYNVTDNYSYFTIVVDLLYSLEQ